MKTEYVRPQDIEARSFEIIGEELRDMGKEIPEAVKPILYRVIHTTADFSYTDTLYISPGVTERIREILTPGTVIVTDTNMALSGIRRQSAAKLGISCRCFMADPDVAAEAAVRGCTRAAVSMERAAALGGNVVIAAGNAPTALLRTAELIGEGFRPALVIGVPVGFVNVVQSKEILIETGIPCIVNRGRKGGSNVAAAIVNALLYSLDSTRGA